ncbi:MAG: hypothetical protein JW739_03595 [Opitutales bacterium]|nr:hypothetical protein [Opitutales bacterium]
MSVSSVSSSSTTEAYQATSQSAQTLGSEDFLKLLAVQLQNQDPLDPMDDTEFISQMANFSSLEAMQELNTSFDDFSASQAVMGAQDYLGKQVTLADSDSSSVVSGVVDSVNIDSDGNVTVKIDNTSYDISSIRMVQLADTSTVTQ